MKVYRFTSVLLLATLSSSVLANDVKFRVTNYVGKSNKTASGHKVQIGLCAADWNHYPPGTIIQLDTGERLIVADKGSKVKGPNHIDRYNPHPKTKFFPVRSIGKVVSRGGYHRNAYKDVQRAFEIRKELDRKAKLNAKQKDNNSGSRNSRTDNSIRTNKNKEDKARKPNDNIKRNKPDNQPRAALPSRKQQDKRPDKVSKPKS